MSNMGNIIMIKKVRPLYVCAMYDLTNGAIKGRHNQLNQGLYTINYYFDNLCCHFDNSWFIS